MFCNQCQLFWEAFGVASRALPAVESHEDIQWARHETVLHRSLSELKHSSDLGCPICRAILHSPTSYEHDALLADENELLDVILEIDASPHPVLSASFCEPNTQGIARIPKRMVAAYAGLLDDGERMCCLL